MKKFFKIVSASLLFLISLLFYASAVIKFIIALDYHYPLTGMLPILFCIGVGTVVLLTGLSILSVFKIKKRYLLIGLLISLCLLGLTKPFNKIVFNSWDRYINLIYDGVDTEPYTKTLKLNYTLENLSNRHLKDVVVVFTCHGYDEDGNDVSWDAEYITHRDIAPHDDISISVMTIMLEKNNYDYWELEVKFVAFKK